MCIVVYSAGCRSADGQTAGKTDGTISQLATKTVTTVLPVNAVWRRVASVRQLCKAIRISIVLPFVEEASVAKLRASAAGRIYPLEMIRIYRRA